MIVFVIKFKTAFFMRYATGAYRVLFMVVRLVLKDDTHDISKFLVEIAFDYSDQFIRRLDLRWRCFLGWVEHMES